MDFIPTLPTFATDTTANIVWGWFSERLKDVEGIAFYKYPNVGGPNLVQPDLTIVARDFEPIVIRCLGYATEQIADVGTDTWTIKSSSGSLELIDSPLLEVDDIAVAMQEKFDRERPLRKILRVRAVLALPLIDRATFESQFGEQDGVLWDNFGIGRWLQPTSDPISPANWRLCQSVVQAAVPLSRQKQSKLQKPPTTLAEALEVLDNQIALLDMEQQLAATQIPPGPQRIRGLAGTGKTVLLALKAANIHRQFPDAKILFTFNTQSLYNQAQQLISRFYRHFSGVEPDFVEKLHIRHAWGGKKKAGVYSDACKRKGVAPLDFRTAKLLNRVQPFAECCRGLLEAGVEEFYDYSLIDEGQDFPKEFFRLVFRLTKGKIAKPIYFAYDELQSLSALEVPTATELFGSDSSGIPLVDLEGEYPGPIEKDFVLHKSYRCPRTVLMAAHAIGLGLYRPNGPVQMLSNVTSWTSVGYQVEGSLRTGEAVDIVRPEENSPNRIQELLPGTTVFAGTTFSNRDEELADVAKKIEGNIKQDGLKPEQIVVISLDSRHARADMTALQAKLWVLGIKSIIPGFSDEQDEFAEVGTVTLATIHRAKGNEAPMIYIICFDSLFDYIEEIENRNKAFTAISRSKAWVRISGVGSQMNAVKAELEKIFANLPHFRFVFPDMKLIRKLDASETTRRRRQVKKAGDLVHRMNEIDVEALKKLNPEDLETLIRKLAEATANDTV